jgi:lipase ATG15
VFFVAFFTLAFTYVTTQETFGGSFVVGRFKWKGFVYADGFSWEPQPQLQYPVCEVQKGFSIPGRDAVSLADFSFLSTMTFSHPNESQPLLDQWFGNGTIIDDYDYVQKYREATGTASHPVEYKLFTIPGDETSAVVGIRGSEAMWDWVVDAQLWMGSVFAQGIKHFNPFGTLWDPILDEVVYLINYVQSSRLKEVSYYRYTSDFVEALYSGHDGRSYDNIRVTGASLGGGLAILTGAITGASTIAFSGLNAMFSRRTFLPPITKDQLDNRVFNTIPQRDLIANIDQVRAFELWSFLLRFFVSF